MLILNVDDDADDREMFQDVVNAIDPKIDCLLFESGSKVIEYLTHTVLQPTYLFVDINMSKMNGYECIEQIRQIPGRDQVRIVMYSTAFDTKRQDHYKNHGIKYLKKSSSFSELVQSIKEILSDSKELAERSKM